jgi:hypothetical protein
MLMSLPLLRSAGKASAAVKDGVSSGQSSFRHPLLYHILLQPRDQP